MSAVAIVQTAFIGDVVLATPLIEAARISCPDNRIIAVRITRMSMILLSGINTVPTGD